MATREEINQQANALRKRGYLPTPELCEVIGRTRSHFDKELKRSIPATEVETLSDGSKHYKAKSVVAILVERSQRYSARAKEPVNPETESLLRESKLERLRRQSRMEELRLEEAEQKRKIETGELFRLADVQAKLAPVARRIRQFSDRCGRRDRVKGEDVQRSLLGLAATIENAVGSLPE